MRTSLLVLALTVLTACGGGDEKQKAASAPAPASPPTTAAAVIAPEQPRRDPLTGGPYPALLLAQAHFVTKAGPDGKPQSAPGPGRVVIVRDTGSGWSSVVLDDPDSNTIHKAEVWDGGVLTIGGNQALLRVWRFTDGAWKSETHWNPTFGGKQNRLRDFEVGDVDGDGKDDVVIATHDQGVIAVVHPDQDWRVEEVDRTPNTFVHEIEIGDVDGDGKNEFFATPSHPNKLDQQQPGEVVMFRHVGGVWKKTVVDAPGDTHAKEILTADADGDGKDELYVVWEGAIAPGGILTRPVTIKVYRWTGGVPTSAVVATIPDRQTRSLAAGDVNGDGKLDLVAGALSTGLYLFEQKSGGWISTLIDAQSSGFEHPVCTADLDGDGTPEIYVGSEDQNELRRYAWDGKRFVKTVLAPLVKGDITWNITSGRL
jgi:hypothetical protein